MEAHVEVIEGSAVGRVRWRCDGDFGATVEVDPVVLQQGLTPEEASALASLMYRQGFLEFSGQSLDADQFRQFGGMFGNLLPSKDEANPVLAVDKAVGGFGTVMLQWHRDLSYAEHPFDAIGLHALDVNPGETATSVASCVRAYRSLPEATKARIAGLTTLSAISPEKDSRPRLADIEGEEGWPQAVHPLAATHPYTGEKALLICPMSTIAIRELDPVESEELLQELFAHITRLENVHRHDWHNGDILIWDNFGCVHARDSLEGVTRRTLRRATIGKLSFRMAYPDWDMRAFTDRFVEKNYMGKGAAY